MRAVTACSSEPWPLLEKSASGRRRRLGLGVQPSLELAEHDPEQQVPPGRLRERAAVAGERRELVAGGVEAVGRVPPAATARRARRARTQRSAGDRRERTAGARFAYTAPNTAPFCMCEREPGGVPAVAARDRLAEQLDVVVAAAEDELVERLLERPHGRRDRAADGAPQRAGAVDPRAQGLQL